MDLSNNLFTAWPWGALSNTRVRQTIGERHWYELDESASIILNRNPLCRDVGGAWPVPAANDGVSVGIDAAGKPIMGAAPPVALDALGHVLLCAEGDTYAASVRTLAQRDGGLCLCPSGAQYWVGDTHRALTLAARPAATGAAHGACNVSTSCVGGKLLGGCERGGGKLPAMFASYGVVCR